MISTPMKSEEVLEDFSTRSPILLHTMLPAYDERAVLVGRTGSGKTTLAEHLLRHYAFAVVLDPKRRITWEGFDRQESLQAVSHSKFSHVIYAPTWEEQWDYKPEAVEEFFRWIFHRENTMLYVDEVMRVSRGDVIPSYYLACVTQGREIGVGVISSTQRPKKIPQVILSEAEHYYVFPLQLSQDRDRVLEVTGETVPLVRGHEFAYKRVGSDQTFARHILHLNTAEGELANGRRESAAPAPSVP